MAFLVKINNDPIIYNNWYTEASDVCFFLQNHNYLFRLQKVVLAELRESKKYSLVQQKTGNCFATRFV